MTALALVWIHGEASREDQALTSGWGALEQLQVTGQSPVQFQSVFSALFFFKINFY